MTIGDRIQSIRKSKKITQAQLAASIGVATGTIQQYELKKRQPKIEILQRISYALEVDITELLGTEQDEKLKKVIKDLPYAVVEETSEKLSIPLVKVDSSHINMDEYLRNILQKRYENLDKAGRDSLLTLAECLSMLNLQGKEECVKYAMGLTMSDEYRK